MPLNAPLLDDRRYDELFEELRRRIVVYNPEWTDHDDSDPGITLLQLFAFMAEGLLFRLNQVPEATQLAFLRLLDIKLRPATAARTMLAFKTEATDGATVKAGMTALADKLPFRIENECQAWPIEALAVARRATPLPSNDANATVGSPDDPELVDTTRIRIQALSSKLKTQGLDVTTLQPAGYKPEYLSKLLTGGVAVDQSALTGESTDADKAIGAVLPSGSVVRRGEGNGVVILTGARTYFGRTTELVQHARPKLHIEAVVSKVVSWLFVIVGSLLGVVVILSLVRGAPLVEMVPLVLVLLMSAVPIALPVMYTISTAVGSRELAKRGVLVTRLSAAEDAATMDVLCVDKTGTITMNQLAVTGVIALDHATEADVLIAGALASQDANQDPIDLAFLAAAKERRLFEHVSAISPVAFAPFDASNRRTEAVFEQDGQRQRVMKGAVRTIAESCGRRPQRSTPWRRASRPRP